VRYVQFIKGLEIDERPVVNPEEVRYHSMENMPYPLTDLSPGGSNPEEYLIAERTIETLVVPIHEFRGCDKEDPRYPPELYIAYAKDVQMLLKMPFDLYKREIEECRAHCEVQRHMLSDWRHAGLWERIKFVFGRRVN
jgi:hypothetical protein